MCGIAGLLRFDGEAVNEYDIETMLEKITHRGRDHNGIVKPDKMVALGHRRLSIIDLHDHATQPMYYAERNLCLTYNGELYNYQALREFLTNKTYIFQTQSDTEVILAAYDYWGEDCVKKFNGMFAFAMWDKRKQRLFCARDHVGIKPFYYHLSPSYFAFASEAFALTSFTQRALNEEAIFAYFMSMYVTTTESIFKSIFKLRPGHTLTITTQGKTEVKSFWHFSHVDILDAKANSIEHVTHLIRQAVKRQLQSDVPVGGFLSGGIDSGLITALAANEVSTYHTYSVGYEGMNNNELPYAAALAKRYQTRHTALIINTKTALQYLDKALLQSSEPIADSAMVATFMLSEIAAKDGVKVLLNGTGGDEIFAGYTRYTGQLSFKRKCLLLLPTFALKACAYLPLPTKLLTRLEHVELDMLFSTGGSFSLAQLLATPHRFTNFLATIIQELKLPYSKKIPLLYQRMFFDLYQYLPNELLFLLDQMTMAHTIEGRVPLLDIDVIHAAYQFKAKVHLKNGTTKSLLKQVALPFLGIDYVQRKKQGFAASTYWWVKKNYTVFIECIAQLKSLPFFSHLTLPYQAPEQLTESTANDLFLLYCFSKWHERLQGA